MDTLNGTSQAQQSKVFVLMLIYVQYTYIQPHMKTHVCTKTHTHTYTHQVFSMVIGNGSREGNERVLQAHRDKYVRMYP